ncbi:SUMF1/EgtB/PvdO family nonheme iron enzyme [Acaryochloris sp. IP29b_bin.148]|uniref:SUMF1/EgtB/PvdO family nonheme iron enzyme n=1 Tax=Acaryochloris sp. IP29b_bin.148 TaxID=2969218 RepID=UPI0026380C8E|nr:SUMF1/EgtB/PvdO family nonheme iron enzyme [Acaryochloris sp. IP29b_bin.148]
MLAQNRRTLRALAKKITVRVVTQGTLGSGVLVQKRGNTYDVLTAGHVFKDTHPGEEAYVETFDGQQHPIDTAAVQSGEHVDLALASFQSSTRYGVAKLAPPNALGELDEVFVAGFPLPGLAITQPRYTISPGQVTSIGPQAEGYGIAYTAVTQTGMSGGPVLNRAGQLTGIHGRAEGQRVGDVAVKSGFNLAIPIETAIALFALQKTSAPSPDGPSTLDTSSFAYVQVNTQGQIVKQAQGTAPAFQEVLGNEVILEMVGIPGGTFTMGASPQELNREIGEGPQHQVTVPAFSMGKFEVTQAQWQAIMGSNPSRDKALSRPVDNVSWEDAVAFCQRLSQQTGRDYRLPSEAEWEYACRAGTTTPFHTGDTITPELANYWGVYAYGEGPRGQYRKKTVSVGSFPANAFGLHEMHGNVSEWCQDTWHTNYQGAPTDGKAWIEAGQSRRVLRGGSMSATPSTCRSAYRSYNVSSFLTYDVGFRVVCSAL